MAQEIRPQDTTRASAYEFWMKAPNPMVTFFKTLDVTNLIKISKRKHMKFNMLLDLSLGLISLAIILFPPDLREKKQIVVSDSHILSVILFLQSQDFSTTHDNLYPLYLLLGK